MSKRVLFHVGTPKTGTSQLQDILFRNRGLLALHGIHYPADRFDAHFLAALDLMSLPWGGLETEAVGAFDALAARVRSARGTSVVSHEIFARATPTQAARARAAFGDDVHVVLSVRDLVRQIPAEWQENVKHRTTLPFGDFLDQIRSPDRAGRIAPWFWAVQEIPDILDRWAGDLPPDHVHLVTVPPAGSDQGLLWKRFEEAFGLAGLDLDLTVDRANPSLGVPETTLIRLINETANREVPPADYRPLVRELLAHQTLSQRRESPRLALPPDAHAWARDLSAQWVEEIRRRGYQVVGDLDELLGTPEPPAYADPDAAADEAVVDAALDAIKALLLDDMEQRREIERLHGELADSRAALDRSYLRPSYKLRERFVERMRRSGRGRGLLELYRRARGRSSRSA